MVGHEVSTKSVMGTTGSRSGRGKRSWPEALKREIVAATLAPGSSVSIVARHYDVNANQVFSWRRRYREELPPLAATSSPQLIPVTIAAEKDDLSASPSSVVEKIEIEVGGKYRIHIGGGFDKVALRRVLEVLERR